MAIDPPFSSFLQGAAPSFQLFICASTLFFIVYIAQYVQHCKQPHFPPGPRPLPVIGNLFDIPKVFSAREYRDLSNRYGMWNFSLPPSASKFLMSYWQVTLLTSVSLASTSSSLARWKWQLSY